jgi:tetratricopeptide (TPR) repeat protein
MRAIAMQFLLIILISGLCSSLQAQADTVLVKKGDSLAIAKKTEEAIALYTRAIKINPKNEKAYRGRGRSYMDQNKYKPAESDYKIALQLNPKCSNCLANMGLIKFSLYDTIAALKYADEAIKIDDKNSYGYEVRGRINFYKDKNSEALIDFNRAIYLDSLNAQAFYFRALVLIKMEEFEKGVNDLSVTTRLAPAFAHAWYQRGIYYANNQQWNEALRDFSQAAALDSNNSNYQTYIANVYLNIADPATAYTYYSKAVKLNDKNFEAHYYKSVAAYRMEEMDNSCVCLRAMQSKLPAKIEDDGLIELQSAMNEQLKEYCDTNFSAFYYQRGIAAYNKGEYAGAIEWYNEGLRKFPGHFMMTSFRGNANLARREYKEAENDYTGTLGLTDHLDTELKEASSYKDEVASTQKTLREAMIAFVYSNRAEVRFNMNNPKGAEADIETALKMMPADTPEKEYFYNIRGILYLSENDNSNALNYFNKAIQANPGFVSAYINRALVKINLAYKIRVISTGFFIQNKNINTRFDLPLLKKTTVNRDNLGAALADCNKAIQIDGKNSYAYQIRAYIKLLLGESDYCYDLLKAEQLGSTEATALINEQKCR